MGQRHFALHQRLDLGLSLVRQFETVGAEELDAIVLGRVVTGRDHNAHICPHRPGQKADRRGRHGPKEKDVHAS